MKTSDLFEAIENCSNDITNGLNDLPNRIKSAKNFVANKSLDKWAFAKFVAGEKFNINYGSEAKPFFYNNNFKNVLDLKDSNYKNTVIDKFKKWSENISNSNLKEKFDIDQNGLKRFELLVHNDQIPDYFRKDEDYANAFDEGFSYQIVLERNSRNQKLVTEARISLGTTCSICNFNFEIFYGLHGKGFIEMHHLNLISNGERSSKTSDLIPVCSNCHSMLHKGKNIWTKEDIKDMIIKARNNNQILD